MAVFLRKNIWYVDVRLHGAYGKRLRIRLPEGTTEEGAREAERRILEHRKAPANTPERVQGATVAQLYPQYEVYQRLHRQRRTANDVASCGKHIVGALGQLPVEDVPQFITFYKQHRQGKVSNRSINKELAWLSGFLKWCRKPVASGGAGRDIVPFEIEPLPHIPAPPTVLSMREVRSILDRADVFHKAYFSLAYLLGMRRNEIAHLTWSQVDTENCTVTIYGKGGKYRIEPIPETVLSWMEEVRRTTSDERNKKGYVFFRRGVPAYCISKALNKTARAAGVKKHVTCHMFRHAFATHLVDLGINLRTVQEMLGHEDIDTTEVYTHVSVVQKRMASEKLLDAFALDRVRELPAASGEAGQRLDNAS